MSRSAPKAGVCLAKGYDSSRRSQVAAVMLGDPTAEAYELRFGVALSVPGYRPSGLMAEERLWPRLLDRPNHCFPPKGHRPTASIRRGLALRRDPEDGPRPVR